MLQRSVVLFSVVVLVAASAPAASRKSAPGPRTIAPTTLPHPVAMFLSTLSADGKQRVAFKAAAIGTRFFFEEDAGVTVYGFDGTGEGEYRREAFLKGYSMTKALKKYGR